MMNRIATSADPFINILSSKSLTFKQLQADYLLVYTLAAGILSLLTSAKVLTVRYNDYLVGNNLQGPYRYAILHSYNLQRPTIEALYLCAHLSTLCLGTVISSLSDVSIFRGMAHSLYNTNFESWLLQEHHDNDLDTDSLKHLLRNAFVCATSSAVAAGIVAQLSAQFLGYAAPFDLAVGVYLMMIMLTMWRWKENYGDRGARVISSFVSAFDVLRTDARVVLVGLVTSFFEATIYIFSIEWTPSIQNAKVWTISDSLPLGFMFSAFMTFNMMGAFTFKALSKRYNVHTYLLAIIMVAMIAVAIVAMFSNIQSLVIFGIFLFEYCVGIYEPSISLLRNQYLPDSVRSTLMNYFRVPRFVFMFAIIIWHFPLSVIFTLCVLMLVLAGVSLLILRNMKQREENQRESERMVLLPVAPSMNVKTTLLPTSNRMTNGINYKHISTQGANAE
ncbi:unnamed protein product [Adineta ricciae]|uniref:Uncharacterized protein n=1 Tax=Adineta ricciae TaxID=249248 RepID=A0A814SZI2_ADIRI|nr:unnamed protein product [Adineta ricciae]